MLLIASIPIPIPTSNRTSKSSLRFATPAYPDIVSDCQNIFVAFWVCPTPCFVSLTPSLSVSLCCVVFLLLCPVLLAKCSRLAGLVCGSIPRRVRLFVVIAAVYDAYSVPLSAVHILWSLPLTVMVGSVASGSKNCMVKFLISDSTLGSCYAALS